MTRRYVVSLPLAWRLVSFYRAMYCLMALIFAGDVAVLVLEALRLLKR